MVDVLRGDTANPVAVAHELGASAARLGYPLSEVFDELESVYQQERGCAPDFEVVRAAVTAWHDHSVVLSCETSCEDPLTRLATLSHLRSRIDDLYRVAESGGRPVHREFALVVVDLEMAEQEIVPLEESIRLLEASEALRDVFEGDEVIAQIARSRIAVLVGRTALGRLREVGESLADHGVAFAAGRLWVEGLPSVQASVSWLLSELAV